MQLLRFDHALLPEGWAHDVRLTIRDGFIAAVERGGGNTGADRVAGIAIPGLPNLHCHAFQRAMAGMAERRGPAGDTFWTWREVMYRFLAALTPEDVEAIAAFAYMEMLEAGFTAVGEFHYLHHDVDGQPYADPAEMASRIAAAATETGIGLTLLPCFYAHGGFGGAAPAPGQRRFLNDLDGFHRLVARTREILARLPNARLGIAPHSLRAVTPEALRALAAAAPEGPIHIHAAEQIKEVDDCVAALGARPVAWLLAHADVGSRWCIVHATHMTADETRALAASGAVAGLCPLTEANLGDGVFPAESFLSAQGRLGVGSDSNVQVDAAAELRQLEYGQRLTRMARNVLARCDGESTGTRLYALALAGGAQALDQPIGAIAPGRRADIVVLDQEHPDLAGGPEHWLDAYIFVGGPRLVKSVLVAGDLLVSDGRHRGRDGIVARYRRALARLTSP
jgi:formiminoglutamate deiminase